MWANNISFALETHKQMPRIYNCQEIELLKHPKFCMPTNVEKRWATKVELTKLTPGMLSKILIIYDLLLIRSRFYFYFFIYF